MGDRNRQLPGPRWDAHDRGEQTTGDTVVSAREDIERVETDGGESERPIVSLKRGNHPQGLRITIANPGQLGNPAFWSNPSFLITYSQLFDSVLANTVHYN